MSVEKLSIKGFRGFAEEQALRLAQPTGEAGSGLTILVGPNNGGKSTVVESFEALSNSGRVSFSEGKRNRQAGNRVWIQVSLEGGEEHQLRTVDTGGSETAHEPDRIPTHCYVLPSRRYFNPYFGSGESSRQDYLRQHSLQNTRSAPSDDFSQRLFSARANLAQFNEVLVRVVDPVPEWTIEQSDQGGYYLKVDQNGHSHSSDGLGDGIVSLLFVVDALYDSQEEDIIVIDEPELSLHPAYQRRLSSLLAEYSKTRQIVCSTHSPYFVDFRHVQNGAEVARVHKRDGASTISQLQGETVGELQGLLGDSHNPHVLGLDAREAFFREDGIVVVEGQEDVVHYPAVLDSLSESGQLPAEEASYLQERFFGWGAGGAGKIEKIVKLLQDLGFEQVAGVFDHNESDLVAGLRSRFPGYIFGSIPAEDVRTKEGRDGRDPVCGLLDEHRVLRPEYTEETARLFSRIAERLRRTAAQP